jgi:SAM-dependent methyltransferase
MVSLEDRKENERWYERYYDRIAPDRPDIVRNADVLFQALAFKELLVRALRLAGADPATAKVLDVGCGTGGDSC